MKGETNDMTLSESLTLILSLTAIIISVISLCFQFIPNKTNLTCSNVFLWKRVEKYGDSNFYCLTATYENRSRLPITITRIKIIINGIEYKHNNQSIFLFGGAYPDFDNTTEYHKVESNEFPINIDALAAKTIRTFFVIDEELKTNLLKIILETTRGQLIYSNITASTEQY